MARARDVVDVCVNEAALLANSGASLDEIRPILDLAREAVAAGDRDIPDERVRETGTRGILIPLGLD